MTSKNLIVVGAGVAGRLLKKDLEKNHPEHRIIGFVDDKESPKNKLLLGKIQDLPVLIQTYQIDEIVIAIPSANGELIRRILLANVKNRIPIRIVPRSQRIIRQWDVRYSEVKPLEAEDFLGRPFIQKNVDRLSKFYSGKTIFVTGGAGSIGSEIVRQLIDLKAKKVIVYDNSEYLIFLLEQQLKEKGVLHQCQLIVGSILHDNKLNQLFKTLKPDIVFHAAAYKHVHLMQDNIDEAIYNNVIGTKRVIDAAVKNKIKQFTFVSTDKVVNPTSIMGATKKLCEYYIASLQTRSTKFNIVRFGNVINSRGSALPLFERQIDLYGYVTVTHKKMQRFFMSIREAAQLVVESTASSKSSMIHIFDMGELINIYEVALCVIRARNLIPNEDVQVQITGLRKGEKMIEELYTTKEHAHMKRYKTKHYFTLKNDQQCPENIFSLLEELEALVKAASSQVMLRKIMKRVFPSLKSSK